MTLVAGLDLSTKALTTCLIPIDSDNADQSATFRTVRLGTHPDRSQAS